MFTANQLAMELSRRQKRISFWCENFPKATSNPDSLSRANELTQTLSLLLSRLARASKEEDFQETYQRILSTERELHNLYEYSRLLTSAD